MKKLIIIISLIGLSACSAGANISSQVAIKAADCPKSTGVYSLKANKKNDFSQEVNFHILNIEGDKNTIKFQTLKHDFIFCRANSTWAVQSGTIKSELLPPSNYAELAKELVNPPYKKISFQGKTYQYRVVLEPKFVLSKDNLLSRPTVEPEKDKVVFELLTPNSKQPQRQTLYTLKDLQQKAVKSGYSSQGIQLGSPRISAGLMHIDSFWWAIAFEQAEGNTGIATIVNYAPQVGKFIVHQPQELGWQQITDLVVTGDKNNPTLWMGTKTSGEGNEYLPANGLVAYRPGQNPNSGLLRSYTVHNSPLVGAIPGKLRLETDRLWVGTGNGVCQIKWQAAERSDWSCWRFAAMTKLPSAGVPLYQALTNQTPAVKLTSSSSDVEVLWWSPMDLQSQKGRYEVRYPQGFTVKLAQGASLKKSQMPPGKPPVEWSGFEWHWQGDRFVRGFDELASNNFGGGVQGIGSNRDAIRQTNWNTIRGDLELLQLSPKSTSLRYYSGWVDEKLLTPYLTVMPQERPLNPQPNPLVSIAKKLQS